MTTVTRKHSGASLGLMVLEPRWMFDGAAIGDVVHVADAPSFDAAVPHVEPIADIPAPAPAPAPARAAEPRLEVVFVDTSVPD
ncbi:MAG: hypothetical protein HQL38_08760, partial [Alphaproteobacteria bacterium]|nr:hypothetical protein [Alphaproteobacteria bacterium]